VKINSHVRRIKSVGGDSGVSSKSLLIKSTKKPQTVYSHEPEVLVDFEVEEQTSVEGSLFNVFENI
jgi:hypothetical protein